MSKPIKWVSAANGDFNNHRGVKLNFYIIRTHEQQKKRETKKLQELEHGRAKSTCTRGMHPFKELFIIILFVLLCAILFIGCANPICGISIRSKP